MPPSLASLASSLGLNAVIEKTSPVAILELDEKDQPYNGTFLRFQYFPDSISDSKAVNWSPKDIPGGSLPLYQWVSSGERSVAFTAVFTTDVDFSDEAARANQTASPTASQIRDNLKSSGELGRNQDIRTAVIWLRRFMMPRYGDLQQTGGQLTSAPRKLQLHMPGTGIGWAGGGNSTNHSQQHFITAIMTACEVEWVAFFPSGFPRVATVSLAFAQIPQYQGIVQFPAPDQTFDDRVYTDAGTATFQYTLPVTKTW